MGFVLTYDKGPRTKLKTYKFDYESAMDIVKLFIFSRATKKFDKALDFHLTFETKEIETL